MTNLFHFPDAGHNYNLKSRQDIVAMLSVNTEKDTFTDTLGGNG